MNNIFIVPSCIKSLIGNVAFDDRYNLTFDTFETIRNKVDNATIVFCDSSIGGLSDEEKTKLSSHVDYYIDFSDDVIAQEYNQMRLKSFGEVYLLKKGIEFAKRNLDLNVSGRMFKLGGRYVLLDEFTMNDYKGFYGKYIFKKRVESWMDKSIQEEYDSTHLLQTVSYSWCFSLVDEYLEMMDKIMNCMRLGFDTEHAHFLNVPKDKLVEFDKINVGGLVTGYVSPYHITL